MRHGFGRERQMGHDGSGNDPKDVARLSFHNREPGARRTLASKKLQSERRNRPLRMPIYIGAFFPACAWYPR